MAVANTSERDPLLNLAVGSVRGGIEADEKNGQMQLAASSQLPMQGLTEAAKNLGIEVIGPSKGDSLFCDVRLPAGWKIVPTDHSMWSELQDEKDVKRASIFYKAAFYDRSAFITDVLGG